MYVCITVPTKPPCEESGLGECTVAPCRNNRYPYRGNGWQNMCPQGQECCVEMGRCSYIKVKKCMFF